jgi:hypothetical protein
VYNTASGKGSRIGSIVAITKDFGRLIADWFNRLRGK